jgi:hypothetical protein
MTEEQYEAIQASLQEIAENTKPQNKLLRVLGIIGLVVSLDGVFSLAEHIVDVLWR